MTVVQGWGLSQVLRYVHAQAGIDTPRSFVIASYQREYSWTAADNVAELFEDLEDHLIAGANDRYVMGSLILCPKDDLADVTGDGLTSAPNLEVIDGQQRILTLIAMLATIRQIASKRGNLPSVVLRVADALNGVEVSHHEDAMSGLMSALITDSGSIDVAALPAFSASDRSASNMVAVLEELHRRTVEFVNRDAAALAYFVDLLLKQVLFSVTIAADRGSALLSFERANNRGKVLDPTDLIKNFVFMIEEARQASPEAGWGELDKRWKAVREQAESSSPKLKFADAIRWHHRATSSLYLNVSGARLYRTVQDELENRFQGTGLEYVKDLESSVRWTTKAHRSGARLFEDETEQQTDALLGLIMIRGQSQMKQHLPLLLAARNWNDNEFGDFARSIEAIMFVATAMSIRPQEVENTVNRVLQDLKSADPDVSEPDLRLAVTNFLRNRSAEWAFERGLAEAIGRLRYSVPSEVRLIRYVLARVDAAAKAKSRGEPAYMLTSLREVQTMLERRTSTAYIRDDLDHIWPRSRSTEWTGQAGGIDSIGNLVLWTASGNRSARDAAAEEKLERHYRKNLENTVKYLLAVGPEAHENYRWAADMGLRRAVVWTADEVHMLASFYANALMATLGIVEPS